MSGPYRDPPELVETPEPRVYILPDKFREEVVFLSSISRVRIRRANGDNPDWVLVIYSAAHQLEYRYENKKGALHAMKEIAEAKQRWEEHLARLSSTTVVQSKEET